MCGASVHAGRRNLFFDGPNLVDGPNLLGGLNFDDCHFFFDTEQFLFDNVCDGVGNIFTFGPHRCGNLFTNGVQGAGNDGHLAEPQRPIPHLVVSFTASTRTKDEPDRHT